MVAQIIRLSLSLAITSLLGRALAPGDFGFFALLSTLFIVGQEILDMGSTSITTRNIAQRPDTERPTLTALLSWRRLVSLGLALACLGLALMEKSRPGGYQNVLIAASAGLFLLHFSAYYVVFQVKQAFGGAVALGIAVQASFLLACLMLADLPEAGILVGLLVIVREMILILGGRHLAIRKLGYSLQAPLLDPGMGRLLRKTWIFGLSAMLYNLSFHSGTFFLWGLSSPEALGSFSASHRLFVPLANSAWLVLTPLIAAFSLSAVTQPDVFQRQVESYFRLLLGIAATIAVCGSLLAPTVLELLYGQQYLEGSLSSTPTFRWITLAFSLALITPVMVIAALATHKERSLLLASIIGVAFNFSANAWLVPLHGAEAAAVVTCITEALLLLLLFPVSLPSWNVSIFSRAAIYLVPAILLYGLLSLLIDFPRLQLATAVLLGAMIIVMLWLLPEQKGCRASLPEVQSEC